MAIIPQVRFHEFLHDIEPSATTKSQASSAHSELRSYLENDEDFSVKHEKTFLSGSYKRHTAIRPKIFEGETDRPNIDIIVQTLFSLQDNPQEVVDFLYKTLKKKYPSIRKQARSVGIETSKADMDVVPLCENYGKFYIPDRKQGCWLETNPPRHTSWTEEVNKSSGGRFKPLVKMVKWWRRENPTVGKRPKGFVIECIVAECMDLEETYYGELFILTLEKIVDKYSMDILLKNIPTIPDPGVPGNSVTTGINFDSFEGFYNKVKANALLGRQALNESDADKATELWKKVFGSRFPKTDTNKTEGILASAVTILSPSFPDKPVIPRKPTGFALCGF